MGNGSVNNNCILGLIGRGTISGGGGWGMWTEEGYVMQHQSTRAAQTSLCITGQVGDNVSPSTMQGINMERQNSTS